MISKDSIQTFTKATTMFTLDTSFSEPVATQGGGEHDTKANHNPKLLKLFPNRNGTLPDLAIHCCRLGKECGWMGAPSRIPNHFLALYSWY